MGGLTPKLGRSPGEGNSYPLQYSGLENSVDCIVQGVAKSRTRLTHFHFHCILEFTLPVPYIGLPQWLSDKESCCNAGAAGDVVPSLGWEDPLEKGMANHSSILAWRIPWIDEPGGLVMGSQRVGHN